MVDRPKRNDTTGRSGGVGDASAVPEFPKNFGTEEEFVVSDRFSVTDTANAGGAKVLEFRAGMAPAEAALPTAPLGTMQLSSNLSINGGYIGSANYVAGTTGWQVKYDGTAEFNNVTVRGYIEGANIAQVDGSDLLNAITGTDYDGDLSLQQMLTNPSFEVNIAGWASRTNATLGRVTGTNHVGGSVAAMRATAIAAAAMQATTSTAARFTVVAGRTYAASAWLRTAATARSSQINIDWYNAGGGIISTSSSAVKADSTTYQFYGVSAVAPALAVSCVIWVNWGTGAIVLGEQHYIDDCALWDVTTFTNLGWSFTGVGMTPFLTTLGAVTCLYFAPTDFSDTWYIETPSFVPATANSVYRATMSVQPVDTGSEPYCGEVRLVFNKATVPENDGALYSLRASTAQFSSYDNFSSGGNGVAETVVPVTLNARFGRPNPIVSILLTGACYIKGFTLRRSGNVTGHITPVGGVTGLLMGTRTYGSVVGSLTANVESFINGGFAESLSSIIQNSEPSGYLDTTRNNLIQFTYKASAYNLDASSIDTQMFLDISFDGGTTYTRFDTSMARNGSAAAGSVRDNHMLTATVFIPAGINPMIGIKFLHNSSNLTATNVEYSRLSWLLIPA